MTINPYLGGVLIGLDRDVIQLSHIQSTTLSVDIGFFEMSYKSFSKKEMSYEKGVE